MIQLVSFDSSQFSLELVEDELISFVSVILVKNNGMTQMHGVRK
jgi:hypothetical protein